MSNARLFTKKDHTLETTGTVLGGLVAVVGIYLFVRSEPKGDCDIVFKPLLYLIGGHAGMVGGKGVGYVLDRLMDKIIRAGSNSNIQFSYPGITNVNQSVVYQLR